ncbi:MAG TPA: aldehyde dehydrogenase family protein [Sporichthyaceae bacterium]|jgi:acyl-CoA reductase-like NAD-dependent aldehyde dehydrogenase|nr:aldehyde dehydrogenase family protein [Sporichthyaceae bacterium]
MTAGIEVVSPASGAVVAKVVEADAGAVDAAVTAARHAFADWSHRAVEDRAAVLERWADLVLAHGEPLATSVSREMGMPITLARITQAELPAGVLRRTARNIREFAWTTTHEGYRVHHVAAGVVAAITPWNMPVYQAAAKLGPALGAGCTAVLKPSELAPTGCETFARLGVEAGLPAGVLGLVHGRGATTGEALVGHDDIDVVSFTGSVAAGSRVGALAGSRLRRVALELGGKSAAIVLDDADLDAVVPRAVRAAFLNSGQACNAPTRLLVPRAMLPRVEQLAADTVAALRIGAPDDPATDLGPLASLTQHERVSGFVQRALVAGARVVAAGPDDHPAPWFAPLVLAEVDPDAEIAQQEVFGPVLVLFGHDGDTHAAALANGTPYGLSAEVWGRDPDRIATMASKLRVGQIKVNGVRTRERPDAPFGGFGRSGVGRELGRWGLAEFLEVKAVLT